VARRTNPKQVRDGRMKKKAHLSLQLEQIEEGNIGNHPNAFLQKARKLRQEELKLLAERNGKICGGWSVARVYKEDKQR
jgi:hypothetical protein